MTTTASPSLTDRYIHQVLRHLPESQRAEVRSELEAALADATDSRMEQGESADADELAVLAEWGDPEALAATYAERPLVLISSRYYLDYIRLLKLLLVIVVPVTTVATGVVNYFTQDSLWGALGTGVWTGLTVGLHLTFWVTLLFALADRYTKSTEQVVTPWTPDDLPEVRQSQITRTETGWALGFLVAFIAALVIQHHQTFVTDALGNGIPVLNPDLWSFWLPLYIAVLLVEVVAVILRHRHGNWTVKHAGVNAAINVASTAVLIAILAVTEPVNPQLLDAWGWSSADAGGWVFAIVGAVVVIAAAVDSWEGWRKAKVGAR